MSITDGQLILDMDIFRDGIRPAVSTGLSVSRVGGVGHNARQKAQGVATMKALSKYREAEEFSHFGSEMALEAKKDIERGKLIFEILSQKPGEYFSIMDQQLMLQIVLESDGSVIDIERMKAEVGLLSNGIETDEQFNAAKTQLLQKSAIEMKK